MKLSVFYFHIVKRINLLGTCKLKSHRNLSEHFQIKIQIKCIFIIQNEKNFLQFQGAYNITTSNKLKRKSQKLHFINIS